jgi:hypothetical protein
MRVQKLREEVVEKERNEHFNTIRPMLPTKQEWRVKEKVSNPALTASDDDMDLLDDDESALIKDGSPPPTSMDINMVFMLPTEFRGAKKEVAQMCLDPKKVVFKKPEESSQHMKPLYVRDHIDERLISRMLIAGGAVINLMSYSIFKKLGWADNELVKTKLMLNGVGGNSMEARGVVSMELIVGSKSLTTTFFIIKVQGNYSIILGRDWIHVNRCVPSTLHQFLLNGSMMRSREFT